MVDLVTRQLAFWVSVYLSFSFNQLLMMESHANFPNENASTINQHQKSVDNRQFWFSEWALAPGVHKSNKREK